MPEKPAVVMKLGNFVVRIGPSGGLPAEIYAYLRTETEDFFTLEDGSKLMLERNKNA